MKRSQFKKVGQSLIYKAKLFNLMKVQVEAPHDHIFRHEIIVHPGAAVIIPMISINEFVMIRQYRTAMEDVIWEFPAGTLEKREAPLTCAKREIIEETGYEARRWTKLGKLYPAPGISTELMHLFLATDLMPAHINLDGDEFIQTKIVPFARLQQMILNGSILDAKTIVGFFYYLFKVRRKR